MRNIGAFPNIRSSRSAISAFVFFVLAIFLGYETSQAIVGENLGSLALGGLLASAVAVSVVILNNWRRGLYLLIGWILTEDLARKYLGNNLAIYFAKDAIALLMYLAFFRAWRAGGADKFRIPFRVLLFAFLWFCLLQTFNPASTSLYYGVLGLKVTFLYVPMVYVGYAFVRSERDLQRVFSVFCFLILIVAGLGLAQSIIGPTFLNPKNLSEDIRDLSTAFRVAPISGLIAYRPTSVFVSAGRFQDFLIMAWLVSLAFAGYLLLRTRRGRTLAFLTVGVVATASLMSASRGVFMWNLGITLVVIGGFLWGAPWRQHEVLRVVRAIQRTLLLVGIGFLILLIVFPDALGSRIAIYSETLRPDSPTSELVHRTQTYPMKQLQYAFENSRWLYGNGFGTCTLGWQYVARIFNAPPMRISVESGFGNLVLELGIGGLILWVLLAVAIAVSAWNVVTKLKGMPWFPLAFAIWLYAVVLFFPMMYAGNSAFQDYLLNATFWFLLGILFRLELYGEALRNAEAASPGQEEHSHAGHLA